MAYVARAIGSRSLRSTRRSNARPGSTGEPCTRGRQAGSGQHMPKRTCCANAEGIRLSLLESCGVVKATCPVWGRAVGKGPAMEPRRRSILHHIRFEGRLVEKGHHDTSPSAYPTRVRAAYYHVCIRWIWTIRFPLPWLLPSSAWSGADKRSSHENA